MTRIVTRNIPPRVVWQLEQQGLHPLLARLYASRGVTDKAELDYELKSLLPPAALTHATDAAHMLADAIEATEVLQLRGVMGVAPLGADPAAPFARLVRVSEDLQRDHPGATQVSAGMSGDIEAAVAAGATHVRVGTALLGARPPLR